MASPTTAANNLQNQAGNVVVDATIAGFSGTVIVLSSYIAPATKFVVVPDPVFTFAYALPVVATVPAAIAITEPWLSFSLLLFASLLLSLLSLDELCDSPVFTPVPPVFWAISASWPGVTKSHSQLPKTFTIEIITLPPAKLLFTKFIIFAITLALPVVIELLPP